MLYQISLLEEVIVMHGVQRRLISVVNYYVFGVIIFALLLLYLT